MRFLRQSTAVVVPLGPFLSPSDGVTAVSSLSTQAGELTKIGTGASFTASSWAYIANGDYAVGFSTGHTDTVGLLRLSFSSPTDYCAVWEDFEVLAQVVYDVLFGTVAPSTLAGTAQTGDCFARLGAPAGASIAADIAEIEVETDGIATVQTTVNTINTGVVGLGSPMQAYTQPTGFLAATFPGTVASTTNITAGTLTTVTNLTNAPTAGDFTAAMKTSLNAATPASVQNIVAQTGDVGNLIPARLVMTAGKVWALDDNGNPVAPAATALSTANWTSARSGYLDNLNVGGPVASHADIAALNQSASKHLLVQTVGQYEQPTSGTIAYTVEARTFAAATGAAVNADTTPILTAAGSVSGDLSGNLSAATNPSTGLYRWTYLVPTNATLEQVRLDVSATINSATFTLSCYTQVVTEAVASWTSTDATHLTAIYNKLPAANIADEALVLAAIATTMPAGATVVLTDGSLTTAKLGSFQLAKGTNLTGLNDIAAAAIVTGGAITTSAGSVVNVTNLNTAVTLPANPPINFLVNASYGSAPGWYAAPDNTDIATILTEVGAIQTSVGSGLGVKVTAVKAQTDQFTIVAGKVAATMGATDYSGNSVQSGDTYALVGVGGASLTALGDARLAHLDANVSTRSTYAGTDTPGTGTLLTQIGTAGSGLTNLGDTRLAHLDADVSTRAVAATALSTATWTNAKAAFLDASVNSRMPTFSLPGNFSSLQITGGGAVAHVVLVDAATQVVDNVNINIGQTGYTPRNLNTVADADLTTGDLMVGGMAGGVGQKNADGLTLKYNVSTPQGTTVIILSMDRATNPSILSLP